MTARACPICHTAASAAELFLDKNIDETRMSGFSFASRKLPEFMSHRFVRCPTCDLVYVDEPPEPSALAHAYHVAEFDSAQEADDAAATYAAAVAPVLARLKRRAAALEIGTGTGIFLESLLRQGVETVTGVEPSVAAIAAAPPHRRAWIREAVFRASDFEPSSFDFICCFMTLEHVFDPQELVADASRLLRPGGAIALVTHNYRGSVNRLLGRRSPIIDIEHMQLFSPRSIEALLQRNGYHSITIAGLRNRYALRYWIRLLPLGVGLKKALIRALERVGLADRRISFNVGNMLTYGYRPEE